MKTPTKSECLDTYNSPLLVDAGSVEARTKDNINSGSWEDFEDNIIWGQEDAAPDGEIS